MHERSYWDELAESAELTIEGNRLIVGEIVACVREEWHTALRWLTEHLRRAPRPGHAPRV